ncbi:MAG TPA: hypothetical protein VNN62_22230 [Methylomirabilota bacterium]|nr:hypothetical protein [Methylomirabilota bacterium]
MRSLCKFFSISVLVILLLTVSGRDSNARAPGGAGPGAFSGELRGVYQVQGKVLCVNCTVQEVQQASPQHLSDLYTLKKGKQQAVFQVTEIRNSASGRESLLGRWEAITGLTRRLTLRADESVWRKLTAPENQRREVQLIGLLQNTGTFDVAELTFVE